MGLTVHEVEKRMPGANLSFFILLYMCFGVLHTTGLFYYVHVRKRNGCNDVSHLWAECRNKLAEKWQKFLQKKRVSFFYFFSLASSWQKYFIGQQSIVEAFGKLSNNPIQPGNDPKPTP